MRLHETRWTHPALADQEVFSDYRLWTQHKSHEEYMEKVAKLEAEQKAKNVAA